LNVTGEMSAECPLNGMIEIYSHLGGGAPEMRFLALDPPAMADVRCATPLPPLTD
jgi:hypothetical protein